MDYIDESETARLQALARQAARENEAARQRENAEILNRERQQLERRSGS